MVHCLEALDRLAIRSVSSLQSPVHFELELEQEQVVCVHLLLSTAQVVAAVVHSIALVHCAQLMLMSVSVRPDQHELAQVVYLLAVVAPVAVEQFFVC
jgi:hypothetical protein